MFQKLIATGTGTSLFVNYIINKSNFLTNLDAGN